MLSALRTGRRCLVALSLGALVAATPAAAADWHPDLPAAIAYARARDGEVRLSVRADGGVWGWRANQQVPSASVLKAMLLVAYLDDPSVRDRRLLPADRDLIGPMIRRSDNAAASRVLALVGPKAVRSVARRAGMRRFVLDPVVWGLSRITAADQTRFFRRIDAQVTARHRATAMSLLGSIVPAQRWGIGRVHLPGWKLYFKGGWGRGTGAVEHQVALLRRGDRRVGAAVLITGSPSHAYAMRTLRGVFARLLRGL